MRTKLALRKRLQKARGTVRRYLQDRTDPPHNPIQAFFCEWNAERLGISVKESRERYARSWHAISYGHRSPRFREASEEWQQVLSVFSDDSEREVWSAYAMHAPMHFLGMLAKPDPSWAASNPIVAGLAGQKEIRILDFGCGLASASRSLGMELAKSTARVSLSLVDIPTIRRDFLLWLGPRLGLETTFLEASPAAPIPSLPTCDVVVATEFFEHVHRPLEYLKAFDEALQPNGFLLTNVADHETEFMHVSPKLEQLRSELSRLGYVEISKNVIFRKCPPA